MQIEESVISGSRTAHGRNSKHNQAHVYLEEFFLTIFKTPLTSQGHRDRPQTCPKPCHIAGRPPTIRPPRSSASPICALEPKIWAAGPLVKIEDEAA